jgi:ring-1,2-phenylacetyl-CoA epoxidase subunit PaaE
MSTTAVDSSAEPPVTVRRIPNPAEPVPRVALPTLALLIGGLGLWWASSMLFVFTGFPWWATIPLNALAGYLLFTVSHDAAHHSASRVRWLNDLMGRLATPFFALHAAFPVWRFIHMQHHRFTNHDDGSDPDGYTMAGPRWQRALRWLTTDYAYMGFYLPKLMRRSRSEQLEEAAVILVFLGTYAGLIATGHVIDLLVLVFVPMRLAIVYLAWSFDYLPHHGLHLRPSEDRLKTTRNRIGLEWLLSPIMLYQNYHLVHHLHPVIPFHRYIAVWRRNERAYVDGAPALSTVRGRELTAQEYRELRALAQHD